MHSGWKPLKMLIFKRAFWLAVLLIMDAFGHGKWNCIARHEENDDEFNYNLTRSLLEVCPFNPTCLHQQLKPQFLLIGRRPCCSQCLCDEKCVQYGNCCPDFSMYTEASRHPRLSCLYAYAKPKEGLTLPHLMITSCVSSSKDVGTKEDEVLSKCIQPSSQNILENIPVQSTQRGLIYRNTFCAQCNGVTNTSSWKPMVWSDMYIPNEKYPKSDWKSVYQYAVDRNNSDINVFFLPITRINQPQCFPEEISDCNVTGLWTHMDSFTEKACKSIYSPYTGIKLRRYVNVFCAICNGEEAQEQCPLSGVTSLLPKGILSVLNYKEIAEDVNTMVQGPGAFSISKDAQCSPGSFYDPFKMNCRPWICPSGSIKTIDNICVSVLQRTRGFNPVIILRCRIPAGQSASVDDLVAFGEFLRNKHFVNGLARPDDLYFRQISTFLISNSSLVSDRTYIFLYIFFGQKQTVQDGNQVLLNLYANIQNVTGIISYDNVTKFEITFADEVIIDHASKEEYAPGDLFFLFDLVKSEFYDTVYSNERRMHIFTAKWTVRLNKFLFCLQMELLPHEFENLDNKTIKVSETGIKIYKSIFLKDGNGKVRICKEDYLKDGRKPSLPDLFFAKVGKVLSIVCICISILTITLTCIAFMMFPSLRNPKGTLNVFISAHLLLAHVVTALFYNINETETSMCKVIGICLYLSWMVIPSMLVLSCVQLFKNHTTQSQSTLVCKCLKTSLCNLYFPAWYFPPVLLFSIHLGLSLRLSEGSDIGYGTGICFLHSQHMQGFFFILPLILSLVTIVVLSSVATMRKFHNATLSNSVQEFLVYAVLDAVIAGGWTAWFVGKLTRIPYLYFVLDICNASQGILALNYFVLERKRKADWEMPMNNT